MLQTAALAFIPSSTFMMLKGSSIITTLIFSKSLIGLPVQSRHLVGCGLSLMGLMLVGMAEVYIPLATSADAETGSDNSIGYCLMLISLVCNGYFYAYEEKLFRLYPNIQPTQMVGYEGLYGLPVCLIFILILSLVPCSHPKYCVYSNSQDFSADPDGKNGKM